ncbi:MAG TPA: hypothetical protein VL094_07795 [Sphingomonadaceae bacterium]|nr:hypothetical protein [Sphingomonadaceae bacterium]
MSILGCNELMEMIDARRHCEPSPFGTKIVTQCLYPSAAPVYVHVGMWGDQFRISDGGEAAQCALFHGRDAWAVETGLKAARSRFSLDLALDELFALAPAKEWIPNVVAAVANGAAHAAAVAVEHAGRGRQKSLIEQIGAELEKTVAPKYLARQYEQRGRSGKVWSFDYALTYEQPILIRAVSPHHNSIASTYTAFSDLSDDSNRRLSVFARRPEQDDAALLRQVAELVPFKALKAVIGEERSTRH